MSAPLIEELLDLSEDEALERHLLGTNYQHLRIVAGVGAAVAFAFLLVYLFASDWLGLLAPAAVLVLSRMVFTSSEEKLFSRYPRSLLFFWLVSLFVALAWTLPERELGLRLVGVIGPLIIAFFRMRPLDLGLFLLGLLTGTLWQPVSAAITAATPILTARVLVQTVISALVLYFSLSATRRAKKSFLRRFRVEESRHRERQRMRQELASARQIQLSMLPRRDPSIEGLDIAAASLPAAEVGGDYFEYFQHGDSELVVVVGDVAGHGVASGLLLSGIRSCLYLLHGDAPSLDTMFKRLDRMVRDTTERRMFITLLYSIFELDERRFTLVAAGHPPPLHYRCHQNTIDEVETPAPPLGTRLGFTYKRRTVEFDTGDVFLLYTDGLTETTNAADELYGTDRLKERLLRSAGSRPARDIREDLLSDLWTFKGDAEQRDDITLVVIKTKPKASATASDTPA